MQKPKQLIDDVTERTDRAVSPVIGVILMVAITVILAAVIGTFVLDLGKTTGNTAPQVSFSIADDTDSLVSGSGTEGVLNLDHAGGEDLKYEDIEITVRSADDNSLLVDFDGGSGSPSTNTGDGSASPGDYVLKLNGATINAADLASSGDQLQIEEAKTGASALASGDQVVVTVKDKDSGKTIASSTITLD